MRSGRTGRLDLHCGELRSIVTRPCREMREGVPMSPCLNLKLSHVGVSSNFSSLDIAVGILARKDTSALATL